MSATRNLFDVAGGSDQDDQEEPGDDDDNVGALLLLDGWRTTLPLKSESANLHRAECMGTDFNVCESLLYYSRLVCKPIFRTPNLSSFGLR